MGGPAGKQHVKQDPLGFSASHRTRKDFVSQARSGRVDIATGPEEDLVGGRAGLRHWRMLLSHQAGLSHGGSQEDIIISGPRTNDTSQKRRDWGMSSLRQALEDTSSTCALLSSKKSGPDHQHITSMIAAAAHSDTGVCCFDKQSRHDDYIDKHGLPAVQSLHGRSWRNDIGGCHSRTGLQTNKQGASLSMVQLLHPADHDHPYFTLLVETAGQSTLVGVAYHPGL